MGAWSDLKEFFNRSEPLFAPMNDPFLQLDRSMASERLQLAQRGATQGELDLPSQEMQALDNVETDVVAFVAEHYSRAQIETSNSIRTYDSRLNGLTLLSKLSPIGASSSAAISEFKAEVAQRRNRLSNSRDSIVSSYEELQEFRSAHQLKRPAHTAPKALVTYSAIIFSLLFETILNSFLLRQNDSLGLLGGIFAALAVGAVNVTVAAVVGRLVWPLTTMRNVGAKAFGWAFGLLWIVSLGVWNLLAAHYRDAKSLGIPNPEHQALGMMGSGLDSIYSWGLFIAGIVFAIIAARAAYQSDDPYPGYGGVTRRHNLRCEDYADEVEDACSQLRDIRDEAIAEAIAVRTELEQQLAERDQILTAREAFARRFDEFGTQLEQTANALLQEYRSANIAARKSTPPKHFNVTWPLPRRELPPAAAPSVSPAAIDAAEAAVERAVKETNAAFEAAIASFEPLDVLKQRLANG